jgi:Sec-independent protein translocase protein TatA
MKDLGQGITAFRKGLKENKESGEQTQTTADSNDKQGVIDRS